MQEIHSNLRRFLEQGERIAFLLFLLTLPFQARIILFSSQPFEEWRAGFLYISDLFLLVALVLGFFASWGREKLAMDFHTKKIFVLGILFLCTSFLSMILGGHTELYSWLRFLKIVEGAGLFLYAAFRLRRILSFHAVAWMLVGGGVVQSIIALLQFIHQHSLGLKLLGEPTLQLGADGVAHIWVNGVRMIRAYGTMPSPNVLAGFLALTLFFLFALFLSEKGRIHKIALLAAQFFLLGGLFVTFSRGVTLLFFVTSLAAFVVLYFSKNVEEKKSLRTVLVFYFLFSLFYFLVLFPELTSRAASSFGGQDAALSERLFFNLVALQAIAQHPWWGVGLGNFTSFFRASFPLMRDQLYQPVHNIFFLIAAESGIVAVLAFIFFLATCIGGSIRAIIKNFHTIQYSIFTFLLSLFFILAVGMYDHFFWTIQQTALLFWLVLGLAVRLVDSSEKE